MANTSVEAVELEILHRRSDVLSINAAEEFQVLQKPNPLPDFIAESETNQSQFQEDTLPACVFKKHLKLAKNEHQALQTLYDEIELNLSQPNRSPNNGLDVSGLRDEDITDAGSKTNLLLVETNPKECSWTPSSPSDLDLSQRIFLKDVLTNPMNLYSDAFILGKNLALPVLSQLNGTYIFNTVIADHTTTKVARLEITTDVKDAEAFYHKLKHAYIHNLEPDSVVMIQNPSFSKDVAGEGYSVRIEKAKDVHFLSSQHFQTLTIKEKEEFEITSKTSKVSNDIPDNSEASLWVSSNVEAKCTADEWKQWGNEYSVGRFHTQALFCYNIALRLDPDNLEALASRAAALINLGFYSAAREDVEVITVHDPFNTGFVLRKVNCLWGLGKYDEAVEYLNLVLVKLSMQLLQLDKEKDSPHDDVTDLTRKKMFIQRIIVKTEKMIQQQGDVSQINPASYFKTANRIFFDEPEYYKPINVINIGEEKQADASYPKKVIANRTVYSGELLVITKAFSVIFLEETTKVFVELEDELVELTLQKMKLDKPSRESFYKLDGVMKASEKKESDLTHSLSTDKTIDCFSADEVKKLYELHFYSGNIFTPSESTGFRVNKNMGGIWTFPTHIRHACVGGNAVWYTCGNLMFIRAIRDIEAEEEIVMAHIEPTEPLESRLTFMNARGITCSCALCRFEMTEPHQVQVKRLSILNDMRINSLYPPNEWFNELTGNELRKLKRCVDNLSAFRSAFPKLNFPIVDPLYIYGINMMNAGNFDEAIDSFEKAYYVADDTTAVFNLIKLSLHLSYCYTMKKKNRDRNKAKKWFNAMSAYAMLSYGCLEPVKINFKTIFEYLEGKGVASLK
ncbi:unnamed protein product [Orchesella dallaii]